MPKQKSALCVLVCLLFLTPLALISGPAGAATTITTFKGGATEVLLTFSSPGADTTTQLSIPKASTIISASISLEGSYLKAQTPTTVDFTFNDSTNNKVWEGQSAENISTSVKTPDKWQGGVAGGNALASDDGVYLESINKMATYTYQQYSFGVNMADITEITIEWNGYAYMGGLAATYDIGAQAFIWNNKTLLWEEIGYYDGGHGNAFKDMWLKKTLTGTLDDYIYNGGELRVVASNWYGKGATFSCIDSDFVKAKVTGKAITYPKDVKLDVANDGSVDFTQNGFLMGMVTFSGDPFEGVIQTIINLAGAGHGNLDIILGVSTTSPGVVHVGNLSIVLDEYINKAPDVSEIPSTFHFPEDTDAPNLINTTHYFGDDLDKAWDMTYAIVNESDPGFLHATITAHGMMSFTTPTENWFGNATFKVKATDTNGLSVTSEPFMVAVDPVPDHPVLKAIGPLSFTEDKPSTITLTATDPDVLFGGTDPLTFSTLFIQGTPFFALNSKSGVAQVKPTEDHIGNYRVNFTVTDSHDKSDSEEVDITVVNVDDLPVLGNVGKQVLDEKKAYELQLTATDEDKGDKDNLKFSVVFLDSMTLFTMGEDGHIAFTPTQQMVGTHHVKFTVTDLAGHTDDQEVIYDIRNVNDPPAIKAITDQKINRNTKFNLRAEGSDLDIGYSSDSITYTDDSKLFDIDEMTGWMNFTPTTGQVGIYTIKVTVTDLAGSTASTTFKLEVVLNNTAPVAKILTTNNKTKIKQGSNIQLTAQASDADNDPLSYKWTEGTKALGTDKELLLKGSSPGKRTITLEVSDGITKTTVTQVISVEKGGVLTPGFDATTLMLALAFLGVVMLMVGRRKR